MAVMGTEETGSVLSRKVTEIFCKNFLNFRAESRGGKGGCGVVAARFFVGCGAKGGVVVGEGWGLDGQKVEFGG